MSEHDGRRRAQGPDPRPLRGAGRGSQPGTAVRLRLQLRPSATVEPNDEMARGLYAIDETSELPAEAVLASLGCGNPTALADLQPG